LPLHPAGSSRPHHLSPAHRLRCPSPKLGREGSFLVSPPGHRPRFVAHARRRAGPGPADPADYSWQTVALAERAVDTEGLSPLADPPHADDGVISLASGYLHSSLMPLAALRSALARAARLPDTWERPPAAGLHALRSWFAEQAGAGVGAQDVLVTSGAQGALSAAFRALVPVGAPLLVESPTYPGALAAARAAGIRPVPVPTDRDGVIPGHLAEAFARTGAQALFCQPAYHNPTGAVLATSRRPAVLAAAAAAGAFVIEDDFARWLSHRQRPPAPLLADDADGHVVYLTSLTKVASPSLRVGAVIARGPVARRLHALRAVDDLFVSRPPPGDRAGPGEPPDVAAPPQRPQPRPEPPRRGPLPRGQPSPARPSTSSSRTAAPTCGPGCREASMMSTWPPLPAAPA
jgi:DNA-binding transcriptional MocR family regulator